MLPQPALMPSLCHKVAGDFTQLSSWQEKQERQDFNVGNLFLNARSDIFINLIINNYITDSVATLNIFFRNIQ